VRSVEVDVCTEHGTWFDRDELPRIARALVTPERIVLRTTPNTFAENVANMSRAVLEGVLEFIESIEVPPNEDRDWGHSIVGDEWHHHGKGGDGDGASGNGGDGGGFHRH
jgi:hypothetical protein